MVKKALFAAFSLLPAASLYAQDAVYDELFPDDPASAESDAAAGKSGESAEPDATAGKSGEHAESAAPPSEPVKAQAEELDTIPVNSSNQDPVEAPTARKGGSSRFVEEIVVTAQKREENMQDVPISIAAFSAERLDAQGIQSTNDLPALTPGLTISGSAGFSLIYLRGIGTSAFIPSFDPSVATYVDGIYIPSQQATLTDLGGVERVEVLKGPQGTLFGRNSTGGAINVITKSPGQSPELSASIQYGNFNSRKGKFYASYPVSDSLAISLAGIYSSEDSYYNVVSDPDSPTAPPNYSLDPEVTKGGRIKIRWTPMENLDLTLAGYRVLQHGSLAFTEPIVKPAPITGAPVHPAGDYNTNANTEPVSNSETTAIYGTGVLGTSLFDIKLLAAYQDQNSYGNVYDFDGGQPNLVIFNGLSEPSKLQTAELQFLSNDEGWTPQWLKWIAGLYYLHQEAGFDPFFATIGDGIGLLSGLSDVLALPPGPLTAGAYGMLETNSYSGFLQGTAELTGWLSITAGARYQEEDRFLMKQYTFVYAPDGEEVPTMQFNQPKVKQHNVSPKVTLEFRPTDSLMAYATWARGFKSGSYNIVTLYTTPEYVDPERVTTYELGMKSSFIDGLTLNAAVFTNSIENLQETKLSLFSGGAISAENAGSARSRGAELDAVWLPFLNANPDFVVTVGATYLDAIYTDYRDASGFDEETGLPFGSGTSQPGRDFTGNRIARTPKLSGNLGLSQTFHTDGGPLEVSGDAYYNGGFNFSPQSTEATRQDAYSLFNARVSYLYEDWGMRITGFVKNLTDKKYAASSLTVDFGTYQRLAPPRTFGVVLAYDFQ